MATMVDHSTVQLHSIRTSSDADVAYESRLYEQFRQQDMSTCTGPSISMTVTQHVIELSLSHTALARGQLNPVYQLQSPAAYYELICSCTARAWFLLIVCRSHEMIPKVNSGSYAVAGPIICTPLHDGMSLLYGLQEQGEAYLLPTSCLIGTGRSSQSSQVQAEPTLLVSKPGRLCKTSGSSLTT